MSNFDIEDKLQRARKLAQEGATVGERMAARYAVERLQARLNHHEPPDEDPPQLPTTLRVWKLVVESLLPPGWRLEAHANPNRTTTEVYAFRSTPPGDARHVFTITDRQLLTRAIPLPSPDAIRKALAPPG